MQGTIWMMLLAVLVAGATGGVVNALMTDNGFILPKTEKVNNTATILRPGFAGNVVIGGVAAVVSWGLYGPLSAYFILGTAKAIESNASPDQLGISLAALAGAVLIGVGGARWLTSEVDKSLLRAAATQAAKGGSSTDASQQIAVATPAMALDVARNMK